GYEKINPMEIEAIGFVEMYRRKINLNAIATQKTLKSAVDFVGIHQTITNSSRSHKIRKVFGRYYRTATIVPKVDDQLLDPFGLKLRHQLVKLVLHVSRVTPVVERRHKHIERKIPHLFVRDVIALLAHNRLQLVISPLHI